MGTNMGPPYSNLFIDKEEYTIILAFIYLINFQKRFIDDISFTFLNSHTQLEFLMAYMSKISSTIKYTFTYPKQTLSFLDVQLYLSESRKLQTKLCRNPTDFMTLLLFHSHHPLICNKGFIYSQAPQYIMIISEDHIIHDNL